MSDLIVEYLIKTGAGSHARQLFEHRLYGRQGSDGKFGSGGCCGDRRPVGRGTDRECAVERNSLMREPCVREQAL